MVRSMGLTDGSGTPELAMQAASDTPGGISDFDMVSTIKSLEYLQKEDNERCWCLRRSSCEHLCPERMTGKISSPIELPETPRSSTSAIPPLPKRGLRLLCHSSPSLSRHRCWRVITPKAWLMDTTAYSISSTTSFTLLSCTSACPTSLITWSTLPIVFPVLFAIACAGHSTASG